MKTPSPGVLRATVAGLLMLAVCRTAQAQLFLDADTRAGFPQQSHSVVAVPLDDDAFPDVAVANSHNGDGTGGTSFSVLLNDGAGNFPAAPGTEFPTGESPNSIVAAELTGDALIDLATANQIADTVETFRNRGDGTFESVAAVDVPAALFPEFLAAADLDGSGTQDLAVAHRDSDSVSVLLNDGTGHVALSDTYDVAFADDVPVGQGRVPIDGKPTAYVCRNRTCDAPVTTVEALRERCNT